LASAARFVDSILENALAVLIPIIRSQFGLSYSAISVLQSIRGYAEAATEPMGGMVADVWPRRWILGVSAISLGIGTAMIGAAPTVVLLAIAFAALGAASGPLRMTGDIVVVQSRSGSATSAVARVQMLSMAGAVIGSLLVSAWLTSGIGWHALQVLLGLGTAAYGVAMLLTDFPHPPAVIHEATSFFRTMRENLRIVLDDRPTLAWLLFLRVYYLMDTPAVFESIWLVDRGHMSPSLLGVYLAFGMCAAFSGTFLLSHWLRDVPPRRIVTVTSIAMLGLFPAWFMVPGIVARFLLGAPLAFAWSMLWPVARAQSLRTSVRPGAVTAVNSLTGVIIPATLLLGLFADHVGLTASMLIVRMAGTGALLFLAWRWFPRSR